MKVKWISRFGSSAYFITGKNADYGVYSGVWDRFRRSSTNYFMYKTVEQLLNGADIQETDKYKKELRNSGEEKAVRGTEKILGLIEELRTNGYKSQYQLGLADEIRMVGSVEVPKNEIVIGMDRAGNFIRLKGGRHRLAVAQHLGIKSIPAILTRVHVKAVQKMPEKSRPITGDPEDFRPFS